MTLFTAYELKEFNSASLTGVYQNFGTALSLPSYAIDITNSSTVDVYITTDGTTNDIRVQAGKSLQFFGAIPYNNLPEGVFVLKKGTQLMIKQVTAPGAGFIVANISTVG